MSMWRILFVMAIAAAGTTHSAEMPQGKEFTNSIGMRFVRIEPGSFMMGQEKDGDWDERPVHKVTISKPFYMAATEVTNAQYEQFDPRHKGLRGKRGLSKEDDEAVIFVSWNETAKFCEWLSQKEGWPYRLPTEAEWEYACRAGTATPFSTGEALPPEFQKHQKFEWDPQPVPLAVGKTPPNAGGLCDMHGNVEEWCLDWYGPYEAADQEDPVGRADGEMKVTRGGSHNTDVRFLRSANRSGALPEDKHWLIGFRVVLGEMPATKPLPLPEPPLWAREVKQDKCDWSGGPSTMLRAGPDLGKPHFAGPRRFVLIPEGANGPLYSKHNHCPSITWCPNGDLLAVWFSTNSEMGREMTIAASRLRRGAKEWDPASEFFKAPDRNMTGSSLWNDGKGTLYHFNGLEAAGGWRNLALVMRTSTNNGATWSRTRLIVPEHQPRNQVISGTLCTTDGSIIQPCDAMQRGSGGTALHISRNGGLTWTDPGADAPKPVFAPGMSGAWIAGIHAGVAQLRDGSLMAFARGDDMASPQGARMPMSLSPDMGKTWTYSASPFPSIASGQRLALLRLREGPLLFCSFTDSSKNLKTPRGMTITDAAGKERTVFGLFAALSEDEGKTWPTRRLITDDGAGRRLEGGAWTGGFTMDRTHAEPKGYLAITQTPDGMIHLISSALHYEFNLAWLKQKMPAE